jgi:predicted transposase YbfD/YdcC
MESTTATSDSSAPAAPALQPGKPMIFDLKSLLSRLAGLTDSRFRRGRRYRLEHVLLLVILAKLCGEDTPKAIAHWVSLRKEYLVRLLGLPRRSVPHPNTYRRVTEKVVKPEELERTAKGFFRDLPNAGKSVVVSIDGKVMRGTISADNPKGTYLMVAYLPEEGIVLMQVEAGSKENEITVAPKLLEWVDLRGKVVAGDAEQTQRQLSVKVLEGGGEYLWTVKDNQPALREDIERLFAGADEPTVLGGKVPNDFESFRTVDKGHGRLETREITVSSSLKGYLDWPGLEQVMKIERHRVEIKTGKEGHETAYAITSQTRNEASPRRLLYQNRTYWGIENGLHHRRDTTFHEDRCRATLGNTGRVMAIINNLVIGLLSYTGQKNHAEARRQYCANPRQALRLLTASPLRL